VKKFFEALSGAAIMAVCIVLRPLMRRWYATWGTAEAERVMALPGDEIVPHPCGGYTQAVGIRTTAAAVWPWVVQIGQDKGGFYSYELLENMVGCNIHNSDRIIPEYQDIKIGDKLVMAPKAPAIPVIVVEPEKALVYGGRFDEKTANTWTFYLAGGGGYTRLVSRWSFQYKPGFFNRVVYNWMLEPIAAVMQRKMLLTIKDLAEGN
jgi:hypothetical protein